MRASSVRATAHGKSEISETDAKTGVREQSFAPETHPDYADRLQRPAHTSNGLIAQLNETWKVADHPLQWRLQRRKGNLRTKNSGWRDRSFCTTRKGLLGCVREYCSDVDPVALAKLIALPAHHAIPNLDVRGTSHARVAEQAEGLASLGTGRLARPMSKPPNDGPSALT